jgi:hypothetical protein
MVSTKPPISPTKAKLTEGALALDLAGLDDLAEA